MRQPSKSAPAGPVRTEISPGLWLDSRLALWLEPLRLLVMADLHWGYAASHRARGNLLPWWGDEEISRRLHALVTDYQPERMLWLGDIVHAAEGRAAVERYLRETTIPITLLAGNHDRRWTAARERTFQSGRFFFHHGDTPQTAPPGSLELIGHHHPAAGWSDGAGTRLKLPALVASPRRIILPAFSPWAAGTPWNERLAGDDRLWAVAPSRIFPLPSVPRLASVL